jgi:hypothetical protein
MMGGQPIFVFNMKLEDLKEGGYYIRRSNYLIKVIQSLTDHRVKIKFQDINTNNPSISDFRKLDAKSNTTHFAIVDEEFVKHMVEIKKSVPSHPLTTIFK